MRAGADLLRKPGRDYDAMLGIAEELQHFRGYLGAERLKKREELEGRFAEARRAFIYDLLRESSDPRALAISGAADLTRIEAQGDYSDDAIALVREELARHIAKQGGKGPTMRFLWRWTPPAVMFAAAIGYAYFKMKAFL